MGAFIISPLPFLLVPTLNVQQGPFAPWAFPHFAATTDLAVTVSSAVDFPVVPVIRPRCSIDFSVGRGRFLQLLWHILVTVLSLTTPPECRAASVRLRRAMLPSLNTRKLGLRTYFLSRPPLGSLVLWPGDSLTILPMALSVGFIRFVSSTDATQV